MYLTRLSSQLTLFLLVHRILLGAAKGHCSCSVTSSCLATSKSLPLIYVGLFWRLGAGISRNLSFWPFCWLINQPARWNILSFFRNLFQTFRAGDEGTEAAAASMEPVQWSYCTCKYKLRFSWWVQEVQSRWFWSFHPGSNWLALHDDHSRQLCVKILLNPTVLIRWLKSKVY